MLADDPQVWRNMLWKVWAAAVENGHEKDEFTSRMARFHTASSMRMTVTNGHRIEAPINYNERVHLGRWLHTYDVSDPEYSSETVWRQRLEWAGKETETEGNTVGSCCVIGVIVPWPVGVERIVYYEVRVIDQGLHGYIAVGWSPESYPIKAKQPGWSNGTYGYHGDDGCLYSAFGFGRRFGETFGTGQVVGTGLILPTADKQARIFFTLDGEFVGMPFENVPHAERLRPAVGLHSPGEEVELIFGGSRENLLRTSPPAAPEPFKFNLVAFAAQLSQETAVCIAAAGTSPDMNQHGRELAAILPWALHEVIGLACSNEPMDEVGCEELLRFARAHHPMALHPSWGVPTLLDLDTNQLQNLCVQVLHRTAERISAHGFGQDSDEDDD